MANKYIVLKKKLKYKKKSPKLFPALLVDTVLDDYLISDRAFKSLRDATICYEMLEPFLKVVQWPLCKLP